jgi:4'-phosphopantetheinyl transferase
MELVPERWPPANGGSLAAPPGPFPGPEAPPRLLLIDRSAADVRAMLTPLRGLLAPEEALRLRQLRREADRERFLLGRGMLRLLLGGWLGRDPADLVLGVGPHGKPQLIPAAGPGRDREACRPHFNVSHAGDLILLGLHACREVGVDVEQRRPVPEWEGIARRCLPPEDWEAIRAVPEDHRGDAFLEAWCRLEARLKARGLGLFGVEAETSAGPVGDLWPVALPEGYLGAAALV